jgi:flagellar P-ring protein precursor FlgI
MTIAPAPRLPIVSARIKDIASLQAGRDNQLIGYGLVVGLQGTGDSLRSSPFTDQSLRAMLQNLGISTQGSQSNAEEYRCRSWSRPTCLPLPAPAAAST